MVLVGVVVCLFAVGMATFLNYFKYRSTADRIAKDRIAVIGKSIENSIQASLAVGLSFDDLDTLPALMERERRTEPLLSAIEVFNPEGRLLYSTNRARIGKPAPATWLEAARRASKADWSIDTGPDTAVGIPIRNNFGLTVGYLAMRYSYEHMNVAARGIGGALALRAFGVFVASGLLVALALAFVLRRLDREIHGIESALRTRAERTSLEQVGGPLGPALAAYFKTLESAEAQIAAIRARLRREGAR